MLKVAVVAGADQLVTRGSLARTAPVTALSTALAVANEVTVYVTGAGDVDVPGCRVVRLPRKTDRELSVALEANPPDVVHAHSTVLGAVAADRLGVPFVRTLHTNDDTPSGDGRLIVPCTQRRSELIAEDVPRHRIDVVPYGVDVDHFTPDGPAATKLHRHRLIVAGDLTAGCGFASVVAALPALPETELLVVGGPLAGVKRLRRFVRDLHLTDRVTMTGPVGPGELPTLLRSADAAVCLSRSDQFEVGAVEAMAAGVAVVATEGGGLADTIIDGVTGLLVPRRDPHALATTVRGLLSRRALCEQFGAAGRDRAWARYSWQRIATETLSTYARAQQAVPPRQKVAAG